MQTSDLIILLVLLGCMATYIPVFMCLFFTAVMGFLLFTDIPILLLAQSIFVPWTILPWWWFCFLSSAAIS